MKPVRKLEFDPSAVEDPTYWVRQDRKKALRILELVQDVQRDPFAGKGKPEPLKYELAGCRSKRIDQEHRLIYQVTENCVRILACRYHY
jgi:toxin YoeB